MLHSTSVLRLWLVILSCLCFFWMAGSGGSFAQEGMLGEFEMPSSINPVGSGARALGMGGGFIAVADDATAASWNPGGLVQLETPEISAVGAWFHRTEDNTFGTHPEASGAQESTNTNLNYLSAVYPFSWLNRNMVVSLNYQHLYDFSRDWSLKAYSKTDETATQKISFEEQGSLSAIGLAYAVQVTPKVSFGLTLNFWEDSLTDNEWKASSKWETSGVDDGIAYTITNSDKENFSFSGFNANLGLLWNVNTHLTLGAVLKTPFTADIDYDRTSTYSVTYPLYPEYNVPADSREAGESRELDMPLSYGIGAAYRFSDVLTISADIYRTVWDDFVLKDADGNKTSPITNKPASQSNVEPTHQVRVGAEYLYITGTYVFPFRCGAFYDPKPAEGSPDNYYGISLGSGIVREKIVFDAVYQYRFGQDVGANILEDYDFSQDVSEHTVYASVIFHF